MATDPVLGEHRAELLRRVSPIYAVTAAVEAAEGLDPTERAELATAAAELVEIVVLMDRAAGDGADAVAAAILALPVGTRADALAAWREAVDAASATAAGLRRVLATPTALLEPRAASGAATGTPSAAGDGAEDAADAGSDDARARALIGAWPNLGIAADELSGDAWDAAFRLAAERPAGASAGALLDAAAHAAKYGHRDVPGLLAALAARLDALPAEDLPAVAAALPAMCAAAKDLGETGLAGLLDEVAALPDAEARAAHLALVAPFGELGGDALLAVHAVARRARQLDRFPLAERLAAACPVETLHETTDGRRLLGAVGALVRTTASADDALFAAEVDLLAAVTEGHPSSAFEVARSLPGRLAQLDRARAADYVRDFGRLVSVMGLRPIGFALKALHGLYRTSPDAARALVDTVVAVGRADGPTAAQWFLLGKTQAGADALRRARQG